MKWEYEWLSASYKQKMGRVFSTGEHRLAACAPQKLARTFARIRLLSTNVGQALKAEDC